MKPERTIPGKWHMTYNGFFKRKSITCRVPFFCFDATKENRQELRQRGLFGKNSENIKLPNNCEIRYAHTGLLFFMLTFVSKYLSNKLGQLRDRSTQSDLG